MNLDYSKHCYLSEEDIEDYEQEIKIKEWLKDNNKEPESINFKYINSKGTARNSRVKSSISLDQKITEDSSGTFADLIEGSDGRDMLGRRDINYYNELDKWLFYLGFNEEDSEWIIKIMLKSLGSLKPLLLEKFLTDLEW